MGGQRGVTLVELVVVMIIVTVLVATALPRFFRPAVFAERGFFDEALAGARYARQHAIATGCPVQVAFGPLPELEGAPGYALRYRSQAAPGCPTGPFACQPASGLGCVLHPAGGPFLAEAPAQTALPEQPVAVAFDLIGRPTSGSSLPLSIPIGAFTLRVEAETGYVHEAGP
jgi:prepilin-type N-terminal cleavage/methylation domain-containing protein